MYVSMFLVWRLDPSLLPCGGGEGSSKRSLSDMQLARLAWHSNVKQCPIQAQVQIAKLVHTIRNLNAKSITVYVAVPCRKTT